MVNKMGYYEKILNEIDINKTILGWLEEHAIGEPPEHFYNHYRVYGAGNFELELNMKPIERVPNRYSVKFIRVNKKHPQLNRNCGSLVISLEGLGIFIEALKSVCKN